MNKKWIFVGSFLLVCVLLFVVERFLRHTESFLATGACPAGFTFFTDLKGNSYCCNGMVKDKQCTATGPNTFCGLAPNLPDRRHSGVVLPTCINMMAAIANSTSGKYCNREMPNYIAPGTVGPSWKEGGCSVAPAVGDGSVFPFGSDGKTIATPACLISGKEGIFDIIQNDKTFLMYEWKTPSCETLHLKENVQCPSGTSVQYDTQNYIRCVSSSAYDPNHPAPGFCYPDEVVALLPGMNLETAKTNCISCSYYKKRYIENDTTAKCNTNK